MDNLCGQDETSFTVIVDAFPSSGFTQSATSGCVPFEVSFTNNATNADSYSWSFPGGTPSSSTEPNPTVVYQTPGTFDVSLNVSNTIGSDVSTIGSAISVEALPTLTHNVVQNGPTVTLENTTPNTTAQWIITPGTTISGNSTEFTFPANGSYTIMLVADHNCGTQEETFQFVVDAFAEPNFSFESTEGCAPVTVTYENLSTGADSYEWEFPGGEPATSTEVNPVVVYNQGGIFDVTLRTSNQFGTSILEESEAVVVLDVPSGGFLVTSDQKEISLTNESLGGQSFMWDFGDGNTSTEENPVHTYDLTGTYEITLTVTNICGFTEITQTVNITSTSTEESVTGSQLWTLTPNPSAGELNVLFLQDLTETATLRIVDAAGKLLDTRIIAPGTQREPISLQDNGAYLFLLRVADRQYVQKHLVIK